MRYRPGDVITYMLGSDTTTVMTHRVVEIREAERMFLTKGDANELVDAEPVSFDRLIGKPVFCIPNIAPVSAFIEFKSRDGGNCGTVSPCDRVLDCRRQDEE